MRPTFPFLLPVLVTESADELEKLYNDIKTEMMPLGIIDEMYVGDITLITSQIARYEHDKVALINKSMRQVWQEVMSRSVGAPEQQSSCVPEMKLETLTYEGWADEKTRLEVSERLSQLQLDVLLEIEAEAIRRCSKELEWFDKMIVSLELRRTRAIRVALEYREAWGRQLSKSTEQVMDGKIARTLDRHPELALQVHEALQKDEKQLRWIFPLELETPRKGRPPRQ
jgi:hypothetical protein